MPFPGLSTRGSLVVPDAGDQPFSDDKGLVRGGKTLGSRSVFGKCGVKWLVFGWKRVVYSLKIG